MRLRLQLREIRRDEFRRRDQLCFTSRRSTPMQPAVGRQHVDGRCRLVDDRRRRRHVGANPVGALRGLDRAVERAPPDRAPVAASSAASVFGRRQAYRRLSSRPCGVRTPCATSGAVSIGVARFDLNRHLLVDLRFPFQREPPDGLFRQRGFAAVPAGPLADRRPTSATRACGRPARTARAR